MLHLPYSFAALGLNNIIYIYILIIDYHTRTRAIFRPGRSNDARNLTAETTKGENTTTIINLSRKRLTDSEQKILEKGFKFTPTPERGNQQELRKDIFELERKLRLAEYFYGTDDPDISLVKTKVILFLEEIVMQH